MTNNLIRFGLSAILGAIAFCCIEVVSQLGTASTSTVSGVPYKITRELHVVVAKGDLSSSAIWNRIRFSTLEIFASTYLWAHLSIIASIRLLTKRLKIGAMWSILACCLAGVGIGLLYWLPVHFGAAGLAIGACEQDSISKGKIRTRRSD